MSQNKGNSEKMAVPQMETLKNPQALQIKDYSYTLPEDRIAVFPLADRSASRLLVYKAPVIQGSFFRNIASFLPASSLLVFNDTRVIKARIKLHTESGSELECFCLEPAGKLSIYDVFNATGPVDWKCMIGNARRWKKKSLSRSIIGPLGDVVVTFTKLDQQERDFIIRISWDHPAYTFSALLELLGELPIPPYLKRKSTLEDISTYNTVYADQEGSVAAPTAGLHFTEEMLMELRQKGFMLERLTLHVGAGTFRQVTSETMEGHSMHGERFVVQLELIRRLAVAKGLHTLVAVGTTSARTLESLYWVGVTLIMQKDRIGDIIIDQWLPYQYSAGELPDCKTALQAVIRYMERLGITELTGRTHLIITPGYNWQLVEALLTNFHQPNSTLLLLVAAMVGDDWKKIYKYALQNEYRFLSYGDACLFFKKDHWE